MRLSYPAAQRRQHRAEERCHLVNGPPHRLGHARGAVLDHLVHRGRVGVGALVVAPSAEVIGLGAVGLLAMLTRAGEHHAAALAVVLGHVKEGDHGNVQLTGDDLEHVDAGLGGPAFPPTHHLPRDVEPARQLLLGEPALSAQPGKGVLKHDHREFLSSGPFSPIIPGGAGPPVEKQIIARLPAGNLPLHALGQISKDEVVAYVAEVEHEVLGQVGVQVDGDSRAPVGVVTGQHRARVLGAQL